MTTAGSTINLCAVDLSKAFDKVNYYASFIKLMRNCIPIKLLQLLEYSPVVTLALSGLIRGRLRSISILIFCEARFDVVAFFVLS